MEFNILQAKLYNMHAVLYCTGILISYSVYRIEFNN